MTQHQKITTFLWFDGNAEEAVNHYVSIFKNSRVMSVMRCGDVGPGPKGSVLTVTFELNGQQFMALNGGPQFKFNEAISLMVHCETQEEINYFWSKLSDGGSESQCGWLKDKFGLSWQVCPTVLLEMLQDRDVGKANRAMTAMLEMQRIDISKLRAACDGR